jgi:hypothetical protein
MTCGEIDPQQNDDMDLLMELSDEALEVACGELMHGSPTLAYGSYCFTCRPHFALRTAPDTLI